MTRAIHRRYDDRPITAWRLRLCADLSGAFDPAYLTSDPAMVTCKKCLYVMGGHVNSNPDRMTPFSEHDLRRIVRGNGPRRRVPVRVVGGVRFVSGGDGHYYSKDGRLAVLHVMRGTPESCWELHARGSDGRYDEYLHGEVWLGWLATSRCTRTALAKFAEEHPVCQIFEAGSRS